jgi:polyhydroxyalkanoate synthase
VRRYRLTQAPRSSGLLAAGFDVYLLDWGTPDERDAANRLEDYVDGYLPAGIDRVRRIARTDQVNLLGYCFGGLLSVLHAAHHPASPLRGLTALTTPADLQRLGPLGDILDIGGPDVESMLDTHGNLPPHAILHGFRSVKPTAEITQYADLWELLWSDEYVAAYQAMTGWATDHVPLPGGIARQVTQMVKDTAIINDRVVLGGDPVHFADITTPFIHVLGNRDHIVPEASSAPLIGLIGSADKHEMRLNAGHVGLLVGRTAATTTIPTIIEFLQQRSEVAA